MKWWWYYCANQRDNTSELNTAIIAYYDFLSNDTFGNYTITTTNIPLYRHFECWDVSFIQAFSFLFNKCPPTFNVNWLSWKTLAAVNMKYMFTNRSIIYHPLAVIMSIGVLAESWIWVPCSMEPPPLVSMAEHRRYHIGMSPKSNLWIKCFTMPIRSIVILQCGIHDRFCPWMKCFVPPLSWI